MTKERGVSGGEPFDLERFVAAQDDAGTYLHAIDELRRGTKTSHWMWFVFPQISGLGHSPTSRHFAITSLEEARAYLAHPALGPRLRECVAAVLAIDGRTAEEVFGAVDAQKLRSSMTLFLRASPGDPGFAEVIDRLFAGRPDGATDDHLKGC